MAEFYGRVEAATWVTLERVTPHCGREFRQLKGCPDRAAELEARFQAGELMKLDGGPPGCQAVEVPA